MTDRHLPAVRVGTHPHVATVDVAHHGNDRFEDSDAFLRRRPDAGPEPIEWARPDVDLRDLSPAEAHRVAEGLARTAGLSSTDAESLVLSLSGLVANASIHGRPPVTTRLWATPGRVTATITDTGPGPSDPEAGLLPACGLMGIGRRVRWIAHQLCRDVALRRDSEGFTIRVTAGDPAPQLTSS